MEKRNLKKERGITLIALVVTIVVLLILAGISINAVLGDNGLITKAKETRLEQANAQVRDAMALWYGDYQIEVLTADEEGTREVAKLASLQVAVAGDTSSFLQYLIDNNIANSDGSINVTNLLGSSLSYGNGTGTSDVYKVEENSGTYQLNYYDKEGNPTLLDTYGGTVAGDSGTDEEAPETGTDTIEPANPDYYTYTFDETTQTATLTGVKEEYAGYYYYEGSKYLIYIQDGNKKITKVNLPSTVEYNEVTYTITAIGTSAFQFNGGEWEVYNKSEFESFIIPDNVTNIGDYAFGYCSSLATITIPASVTNIGNYAFYYCSSLTSVTIPESVTSIGSYGFSYCSNLESITIPNTITSIKGGAFSGCKSLENIVIPNSITSIENSVFSGCSSLTSIEIPNSIISIESGAFTSCEGLTSIIIPESVTSIGSYGFSYCSNLETIILPEGITSIGGSAFYNCSSLESINIPSSVTSIESYAFYGCSGLESVTILNGVTGIKNSAFCSCDSLISITIPTSVTSIENFAFYGCTNLTTVNYRGTQEQWDKITIGSYNTSLTNATIVPNYSE